MNRILVIGGLGFIGRHLCKALEEKGYRVIVPPRDVFHSYADIVFCLANLPPWGILNLRNACKDKKLIYFSSIAALDSSNDEYVLNKQFAERLLKGMGVIIRPPLVYNNTPIGWFHKIMGMIRGEPTISMKKMVDEAISCMDMPNGIYNLWEEK